LIEDGLVDEDGGERQPDLLEDIEAENQRLISSDEDLKTPDVRAIEKNLRKKLEQK
jgi:hypothetical protein